MSSIERESRYADKVRNYTVALDREVKENLTNGR